MKRRLMNTLYGIGFGALSLLSFGCSDDYNVRGKIVDGGRWDSPFGDTYSVYVPITVKDSSGNSEEIVNSFDFIGTPEELDSLDRIFSIGDSVKINSKSIVFSLTNKVLSPNDIKKDKEMN
ncbi:hypothetical protein K8R47_02465 [archaeon]|nr:hypothetical protein [archaeon]